MNSSKYNGITEGVIWKQLMLFFLPVLLGTFFQQLYNTVDAVIVGRFVGKEALAAVGGSSSQILNLLIGFFTGVTSGAAVIVAQYYGARDAEDSSRSVHTAMILAIACGAIMTVVGILTAPALLRIMETPEGHDGRLHRVYALGVHGDDPRHGLQHGLRYLRAGR